MRRETGDKKTAPQLESGFRNPKKAVCEIRFRVASLRWNYPDQVLRVADPALSQTSPSDGNHGTTASADCQYLESPDLTCQIHLPDGENGWLRMFQKGGKANGLFRE
jgi:hypothetical protein